MTLNKFLREPDEVLAWVFVADTLQHRVGGAARPFADDDSQIIASFRSEIAVGHVPKCAACSAVFFGVFHKTGVPHCTGHGYGRLAGLPRAATQQRLSEAENRGIPLLPFSSPSISQLRLR